MDGLWLYSQPTVAVQPGWSIEREMLWIGLGRWTGFWPASRGAPFGWLTSPPEMSMRRTIWCKRRCLNWCNTMRHDMKMNGDLCSIESCKAKFGIGIDEPPCAIESVSGLGKATGTMNWTRSNVFRIRLSRMPMNDWCTSARHRRSTLRFALCRFGNNKRFCFGYGKSMTWRRRRASWGAQTAASKLISRGRFIPSGND